MTEMSTITREKQKQRLTFAVIVLLCLPFMLSVSLPKSLGYIDLTLYIALITGFLGIIVLLTQFLLGTRSITGLIYRDLPWTLRIHKNLGIYGTLLIFLHPVLILFSYAQNLLYIFIPRTSSSFETSVTWGRIALYALLIIWITSALLRKRMKYRLWKYIHYLGYSALPLAFVHSPPIGRTLTEKHGLILYWYFLVLVYLVLLALRLRHVFGYSKHQFSVVSVDKLTDEVLMMWLQGTGGALRVRPGQYVYVQLALGREEHPFTVVDIDPVNNQMLIAFKVAGSFTWKLSQREPGTTVHVDGPYGMFTQTAPGAEAAPRVFIAGGIGITPFVSNIIAAASSTDQYLFYCNRTSQTGAYRRQLQQKLGSSYIDVFSQDPAAQGSNIEHGYITEAVLMKYLAEPTAYEYYICGPAGLSIQTKRILHGLGVHEARIHSEEFGF
jgi:predicted ferric reductase